jgi:glycosyltransferase A (GT-A) superfamily protein (DUF2064 family)
MRIPVCIFAKPPAPLEAKTRLIPALGAEGAAQLASAMLREGVARSPIASWNSSDSRDHPAGGLPYFRPG